MKILLLGGNGQLGRSFIEQGGLAALGALVVATRDGQRFDGGPAEVADLAAPEGLARLLDRVQPQLIVNAAAYTAVDRAEQEEALANRVNGEALGAIGAWAASHDACVVHFSTDYVFDGSQSEPYATDAPTAPLGAYGRSKLAGELALKASGADHLILRTAWVYAAHGQNFLRTMLRLGADRDELRVVADQHGAPTSTDIIVNGTLAALDRWHRAGPAERLSMRGVHHLVARGTTTWHGFARAIFDEAQAQGLVKHVPRIVPISSDEFPAVARRPMWSVLSGESFTSRFGHVPPTWQQGLRAVIRQLVHVQESDQQHTS